MPKHQGQLELTWTDKDKTLLSSGDGKYDYTFADPSDHRVSEVRLLHEVERVEAPDGRPEGSEQPAPTTENLLITGDAMHVLDALSKIPEYADKYLGKVKLVYIDPPFNTGQAFENYEDNIEHSVWLTMLRDRLRQIKPLLADDGSVWVHLDDVEVHRCRSVMDEELGPRNFIGQVVWEKVYTPDNRRAISPTQDYILVYANSPHHFKRARNLMPRGKVQDSVYRNLDSDPRGSWRPDNFTAQAGHSTASQTYELETPAGNKFWPPAGRAWVYTEPRYRELLADNRVYFGKNGAGRPNVKRFLSEVLQGVTPDSWWPYREVGHNQDGKKEIKFLFPDLEPFATPKPERLLQRIIHISTNPGDMVLDCFAGSGTTAAVAHKMGRRWVTSELLPETSDTFTKPRLAKVVNGEDPGGITSTKERLAAGDLELPAGMTPTEAKEFARLLNKVAKSDGLDLDKDTIKALRSATKTKDVTTANWYGGGGFTHLQVGPSMFEEVAGMVLLADWATQGDLTRAMCAQLGVRYRPDGIFSAKRGRTRYIVIDGMVGVSTVESIVDRLNANEIVEVWATQIESGASDALRAARPGSSLKAIPSAVLDNYRRKAAKRSPFAGHSSQNEGDA